MATITAPSNVNIYVVKFEKYMYMPTLSKLPQKNDW